MTHYPSQKSCTKSLDPCCAYLKVVNTLQGNNVEILRSVLLDGICKFGKIPYGFSTPSVKLSPGKYNISVKNFGDNDTKAFTKMVLNGGQSYSAVLFGEDSNPDFPVQIKVIEDVPSTPNPGMTSLRLIHTSPGAPAVGLLAGQIMAFVRAEYGGYGGPNIFMQFRACVPHQLMVIKAQDYPETAPMMIPSIQRNSEQNKRSIPNKPVAISSSRVIYGPVNFNAKEGDISSLYVIGKAGDQRSPLGLLLVTDFPVSLKPVPKQIVLTPISHPIDETEFPYAKLRVVHGRDYPLSFMQGDNRFLHKVPPMNLTNYAIIDPSEFAKELTIRMSHHHQSHHMDTRDTAIFDENISSIMKPGRSYTLAIYPENREPQLQLFDDTEVYHGHTRFLNMGSLDRHLEISAHDVSPDNHDVIQTRQGEWVKIPHKDSVLEFSTINPSSQTRELLTEPYSYRPPNDKNTHTVLVSESNVHAF